MFSLVTRASENRTYTVRRKNKYPEVDKQNEVKVRLDEMGEHMLYGDFGKRGTQVMIQFRPKGRYGK